MGKGNCFLKGMLPALAAILLGGLTAMAQEIEQLPAGGLQGAVSMRTFGARADGISDDTAAFQAAINEAAKTGGVVDVPPGKYLIAGSLEVKKAVTVRGANPAPMSIEPLLGTVILATGGRDNESAPALFEMDTASTVQGLTVFYPEQKPTEIHPYPWTFHLKGFDNTVENVTLINSYNGIKTGPENNVRHRIRSVVGCVLRRGIFVDYCTDIGRIENVQFHCHWWSHPDTGGDWGPVFDYMVANLEAFVFGRTDWEYVTNTFAFPAKIAYRFIRTEQGGCNGQFTGVGADATETSVQVDEIQDMGLLFTGGQFVSLTGTNPVQIRIAETNRGSVRFVNCAFWGPSARIAEIRGKGFVSFSDCLFSDWRGEKSDVALLYAASGRVQVTHSSFQLPSPPFPQIVHPSIELGPEVTHAIIEGNNGTLGVRVVDNSGGKAILANNEPPRESEGAEEEQK